MKHWLVLCCVMLLAVGRVSAQDVLRARFDSDEPSPLVGQVIELTLLVEVPAGYEVDFPEFVGEWGVFSVLSAGEVAEESRRDGATLVYTLPLQIIAWETGEVYTPTVFVEASSPQETVELLVDPFVFDIPSVLDETLELRTRRSVVDLFYVPYVLIAVLLTAAIGIGVITLFILRKRVQMFVTRVRRPVEVQHSPMTQTMAALEAIYHQGGDTSAQLIDVGNVLRQFIAAEMDIPAPDMTTSELIGQLRSKLPDRRVGELQRLLELADLAKFAPVEVQRLGGSRSPTEYAAKWLRSMGFEP